MTSWNDQESFSPSKGVTSVDEKCEDDTLNVMTSKEESSGGQSLNSETSKQEYLEEGPPKPPTPPLPELYKRELRRKETSVEEYSEELSKGEPLKKNAQLNETTSNETPLTEMQSKPTALNETTSNVTPLSETPLNPKKKTPKKVTPKKETPASNDKTKQKLPKLEDPESNNSVLTTKNLICRLLDSDIATAIMSVTTVFALYGDDVRILAFEPSADGVFLVLSAIAFFLFLTEIALLSWCKANYIYTPDFAEIKDLVTIIRWKMRESTFSWLGEIWKAMQCTSFYFWLDLISTLSMVIEMPWFLNLGDAADSIDSTMAGKASLAGAKAANKLKILRMVRLVRLAKLYKYFSAKRSGGKTQSYDQKSILNTASNGLDLFPPESHVGAEMSDRTTKKVIIGILVMLIGIPLLQADEVDYHKEFEMKMILDYRKSILDGDGENELENLAHAESSFLQSSNCIAISYGGFEDDWITIVDIPIGRPTIEELRKEEMEVITVVDTDRVRTMTSIFDATTRVQEEAMLGIFLTSFVIVLLALGMVSFTKDVRNLVIVPIERMVELVHEISENPLGNNLSSKIDDINQNDDGFETTLLLRTISKIAGLMRVGFGEAGADIIGKNLNMADGDGTINLLGNGRKIQSIFGFCDVRQFTDTTECLQEEVMLFVNRIAHILHSIVVQCDGAANKNIGDAFLLTWKVKSNDPDCSFSEEDFAGDKALYSFIKTMIEMNRHEDFLCNFSSRALSELYDRMPGYKCRIGCGLHFGWAIEGAIGSNKKIDASYISPHVNMSETLEGLTKEYGVSILMSEPFYDLLSPQAAAGCRKVDVIETSESQPMGIYTFDADLSIEFTLPEMTAEEPNESQDEHQDVKKQKFSLIPIDLGHRKQKKEKHKPQKIIQKHDKSNNDLGELPIITITGDFPDIWYDDKDISRVQSHFSSEQRTLWEKGIEAFEEGNWDLAKTGFEQVLQKSDGKDGPSLYLLGKMKEYDFVAPESWQGYWQKK